MIVFEFFSGKDACPAAYNYIGPKERGFANNALEMPSVNVAVSRRKSNGHYWGRFGIYLRGQVHIMVAH